MRIGRLEIHLMIHPKPKLKGWKCPVHGELMYILYACPKCGKGVSPIMKE